MPDHLPPSFEHFLDVVGVSWPEAQWWDLYSLSDDWGSIGAALLELATRLRTAATELPNVVQGASGDALVHWASAAADQCEQLAGFAQQLADSARNAGGDVLKSKFMMVIQLIVLAVTVAVLAASLFGAFAIPSVIASMGAILRAMAWALVINLSSTLGLDMAFQGIELLAGGRASIDPTSLLDDLAGGTIGGLAFGLGGVVGSFFRNAVATLVDDVVSDAIKGPVSKLVGATGEGLIQGLAGTAGSVVTDVVTGQPLNLTPAVFTAALLAGLSPGGGHEGDLGRDGDALRVDLKLGDPEPGPSDRPDGEPDAGPAAAGHAGDQADLATFLTGPDAEQASSHSSRHPADDPGEADPDDLHGAAHGWRAVLEHVTQLSGVADLSWASRFHPTDLARRRPAVRLESRLADGRPLTVLASVDPETGHTVLAAQAVAEDGGTAAHVEALPGFDGRPLLDLAGGATLRGSAAADVANRLGAVLRPTEHVPAHTADEATARPVLTDAPPPGPDRHEAEAGMAVLDGGPPVPHTTSVDPPIRLRLPRPGRTGALALDGRAAELPSVESIPVRVRNEPADAGGHRALIEPPPPGPDRPDAGASAVLEGRPPVRPDAVVHAAADQAPVPHSSAVPDLPTPLRFQHPERVRALSADDSAALAAAAPGIARTAAQIHTSTGGRSRLGVRVTGSGNGRFGNIDAALATGERRAANVAHNLAAEVDPHLPPGLTHEDIAWTVRSDVDPAALPQTRRTTTVEFSVVDSTAPPADRVIRFAAKDTGVHTTQIMELRALGRQAARHAVELRATAPDRELVVTVTGHGNGYRITSPNSLAGATALARAAGLRRANSVIDELETGLVRELALLPDTDGVRAVVPSDVVIVREPAGRIPGITAAHRRIAEVTFTTRPRTESADVAAGPRIQTRPDPAPIDIEAALRDDRAMSAALREVPLELTTRVAVPEVTVTPADQPHDPSTSDGDTTRPPWYLEHGAMGEIALRGLPHWTTELAGRWAAEVARSVGKPELTSRIRTELVAILASDDQRRWSEFLARGEMFVEHGHVVWLRPALTETGPWHPAEEEQQTQDSGDANEFATRFSSITAGVTRGKSSTMGFDSAAVATLNVGLGSVTHAVGVSVGADATETMETGRQRLIVSGGKLFVDGMNDFASALRIRAFVDGDEHLPDRPVIVPRDLHVQFPEQYSGKREPAPPPVSDPFGPKGIGRQEPRFPLQINSIDLAPALAGVQRRLLAEGVGPAAVVRISAELVEELFTEPGFRARTRWVLTSGHPSGRMRFRSQAIKPFLGHATVTVSVDSARLVDVAEDVPLRADLGAGRTNSGKAGARNTAALGVGYHGLDSAGHGTAFHPTWQAGGLVRWFRTAGLSGSTTELNHTVANETGPQARYHGRLAVEVDFDSSSHPGVGVVREVVDGEVGVPWRGGAGPRDFEKAVFGHVHSAELRAAGDGIPLPVPGPIAAHPLVLALMWDKSVVRTLREDPPEAMSAPIGPPDPREPFALAARRGLGMGTAVKLPGVALVHDQIRWQLRQLAGAGSAKADWSAVDRELAVLVGEPAAEADLSDLLAGVKDTVTVAGQPVTVAVQAHVRQRLDGSSHDLAMTSRALAGHSVAGFRERGASVRFGGGAETRLKLVDQLRLHFGGLNIQGEVGRRTTDEFGSGRKSYRRIETSGRVDQHDYAVVYRIRVGDKRWWVGEDTLAQIVLSHKHVVTAPPAGHHARPAEPVEHPTSWPRRQPNDLDFVTGGTAGVYPAFFVMHELSDLAATMYARMRGLPESAFADWTERPAPLHDLSRPAKLASHFTELADRFGWSADLPPARLWNYTVTVKLRVTDTVAEDLPEDVEIEHYVLSSPYHKRETEWALGGAVQGVGGLQVRAGAGRVNLLAHGSFDYRRARPASVENGNVVITRVSYQKSQALRGTPVFEVTMTKSNRFHRESATAYLRVPHGVELRIPPRRLDDLRGTAVTDVAPVTKQHLFGVPVPGTFHIERLAADGILDEIVTRLTDGIHLLRPGGAGQFGVHQETVLRSLRQSFSSGALEGESTSLFGTGVWRWLPIKKAPGITDYLWVRVRADGLFPAHQHRERPDAKLTLRTEALTKTTTKTTSEAHTSLGATALARFGLGDQESGDGALDPGDIGGEIVGGYSTGSSWSKEHEDKELNIFRANPTDRADEFDHVVRFHVDIGWSTEMPPLFQAPHEVVKGGFWAAGEVLAHSEALDRFWRTHVTKVERLAHHVTSTVGTGVDDGSRNGRIVQGTARLLVARHMTLPSDTRIERPIVPRPQGENARWVAHRDLSSEVPPASLIDSLHPLYLPAATAAFRWLRLAVAGPGTPMPVGDPAKWEPAGLDFTTGAGLRYHHDTTNDMLAPRIAALLRFTHVISVGGQDVRTGLRITGVRAVGPAATMIKARRYDQREGEPKFETAQEGGWIFGAGPEGGGAPGDDLLLQRMPVTLFNQVTSERHESRLTDTQEQNTVIRGFYRYFAFDVTMLAHVVHRPATMLAVDIPDGLLAMLRVDKDGNLLGTLPAELPDLFGAFGPSTEPAATAD